LDSFDQGQIRLLAEIGLAIFERDAKQKAGPSLREKMANIKIDVGQDAPGDGGAAPDNRTALAQAIILSGKKRRGEIT
jgi:hypothetical protein